MSPQPAAAPPQEKPAEELSAHAKYLVSIGEMPEDDRTSAETQILRAAALERERASVLKRIDSNRKYLRLMADNEELSDEQEGFLDTFYPDKEKGERRSDPEVEATRKLKEEVRRMGRKAAK